MARANNDVKDPSTILVGWRATGITRGLSASVLNDFSDLRPLATGVYSYPRGLDRRQSSGFWNSPDQAPARARCALASSST